MAVVDITILGSVYKISCDDGEEAKLLKLAEQLDSNLQSMQGSSIKKSADNRLLILNSLIMQDKINELEKKLINARFEASAENQEANLAKTQDEVLSRSIDAVAEYVIGLAEKI